MPGVTISHNTRSINVLIMGPLGHTVGNATDHGSPLGIFETFQAAGEYDAADITNIIFLPAPNSDINIPGSSLRNRHAQANLMKGITITPIGSSNSGPPFQKYTHNFGVFGVTPTGQGNLHPLFGVVTLFLGAPSSADTNSDPNPGQPSSPCRMSAFQAGSGRNKHYGTVYNFDGNTSPFGQSMIADITMPSAGNGNAMNPVSMGVSAGV